MAYKKSTSKAKAAKADEKVEVAAASEDCCAKCDSKIADLDKKVSDLEKKLKGLLDGIDAASKLKAELDEAKLKLSAEVKELQEKAKGWKEKADTNKDGSVDFEELYKYVYRRLRSRNSTPKK